MKKIMIGFVVTDEELQNIAKVAERYGLSNAHAARSIFRVGYKAMKKLSKEDSLQFARLGRIQYGKD